jgi:hypothetical protein
MVICLSFLYQLVGFGPRTGQSVVCYSSKTENTATCAPEASSFFGVPDKKHNIHLYVLTDHKIHFSVG